MAKSTTENVGTRSAPSKAAATGTKPVDGAATAEGTNGKGAPRPRKQDYGIEPAHKVQIVPLVAGAEDPKLKAGEAEGYAIAKKGCTVEAFIKASDRGILRRLSRKGLVNVIGADGTKYPIPYVAKEKPVKEPKAPKAPKAEAGKKAAA